MIRRMLPLLAVALLAGGCHDDDPVRVGDVTPPAAPRGFYSVTGDQRVYLYWLPNTESDVAGYRIRISDCPSGPTCPFELVGSTTQSEYTVTGLANGVRRYYAIEAYDHAGNISDLTYEDVHDTPRPEGVNATLLNSLESSAGSGWDFSAQTTRADDDPLTDIYYAYNGSIDAMFAPDLGTDIQDAGYVTTLDAIDYAPDDIGWSPTGSVELIEGHAYIVLTRDGNYAKFRVRDIVPGTSTPDRVVFDWAYQVAPGNRELRNRPVRPSGPRPVVWPSASGHVASR